MAYRRRTSDRKMLLVAALLFGVEAAVAGPIGGKSLVVKRRSVQL